MKVRKMCYLLFSYRLQISPWPPHSRISPLCTPAPCPPCASPRRGCWPGACGPAPDLHPGPGGRLRSGDKSHGSSHPERSTKRPTTPPAVIQNVLPKDPALHQQSSSLFSEKTHLSISSHPDCPTIRPTSSPTVIQIVLPKDLPLHQQSSRTFPQKTYASISIHPESFPKRPTSSPAVIQNVQTKDLPLHQQSSQTFSQKTHHSTTRQQSPATFSQNSPSSTPIHTQIPRCSTTLSNLLETLTLSSDVQMAYSNL